MVEILTISPQANVEAVRRQLAQSRAPHVALVLPEGWHELENIARLRLLQRQAQIQHCQLALITRHEATRKLAMTLGIPVFAGVEATHGRTWRMYPELPLVDPRRPDQGLPEPPPWRRDDVVARSARPTSYQARRLRILAEERARQPLPFWLRLSGYMAMGALLLIVMGAFARYVLPAATVTLTPGRAPMAVSVALTADGSVTEIDAEANILPRASSRQTSKPPGPFPPPARSRKPATAPWGRWFSTI